MHIFFPKPPPFIKIRYISQFSFQAFLFPAPTAEEKKHHKISVIAKFKIYFLRLTIKY